MSASPALDLVSDALGKAAQGAQQKKALFTATAQHHAKPAGGAAKSFLLNQGVPKPSPYPIPSNPIVAQGVSGMDNVALNTASWNPAAGLGLGGVGGVGNMGGVGGSMNVAPAPLLQNLGGVGNVGNMPMLGGVGALGGGVAPLQPVQTLQPVLGMGSLPLNDTMNMGGLSPLGGAPLAPMGNVFNPLANVAAQSPMPMAQLEVSSSVAATTAAIEASALKESQRKLEETTKQLGAQKRKEAEQLERYRKEEQERARQSQETIKKLEHEISAMKQQSQKEESTMKQLVTNLGEIKRDQKAHENQRTALMDMVQKQQHQLTALKSSMGAQPKQTYQKEQKPQYQKQQHQQQQQQRKVCLTFPPRLHTTRCKLCFSSFATPGRYIVIKYGQRRSALLIFFAVPFI